MADEKRVEGEQAEIVKRLRANAVAALPFSNVDISAHGPLEAVRFMYTLSPTSAIQLCDAFNAASTPEAAGRGDGWARGVRSALREVQAERLEKHEQYLMIDPALQDADAAYSSGIRDAERAIEKLLLAAGAAPFV